MKRTLTFWGCDADKASCYMRELYNGMLNMECLESETYAKCKQDMEEDVAPYKLQKFKVTLTVERIEK